MKYSSRTPINSFLEQTNALKISACTYIYLYFVFPPTFSLSCAFIWDFSPNFKLLFFLNNFCPLVFILRLVSASPPKLLSLSPALMDINMAKRLIFYLGSNKNGSLNNIVLHSKYLYLCNPVFVFSFRILHKVVCKINRSSLRISNVAPLALRES